MKLYLITHSGKIQWYKLEAWAEIEKIGENGIYVRAVKAFIRKKHAKDWIKKNHCEHLEIKTVEFN